MKWLVRIIITLLVLVGLFALVVLFFFPNSADVTRTATIDAPPATVFNQVNVLQNWEKWSAWAEMDDNEVYVYSSSPEAKGKGAWYSWDGENMKQGKMTVTESIQNKLFKTDMDFGPMGTATAEMKFEAVGPEQTKVTWDFHTETTTTNIMGKLFMPMIDSEVGGSFEKGFANLNKVAAAAYVEDKKVEARKKVMELRRNQAREIKEKAEGK